ncbi:hypothetical protein [Sagittula sp. S175]|uniref:hypothetical protein n=1 Tax=Sagittula sp. S175 TaxID=3415129 RepID=UPI003C7DC8E3
MTVRDLSIFADYHQFYIYDAQMQGTRPEDWTTDDMLRKVICGGDHLVVFTARNMDVPVRVEVLPEAPPLELFGWDHMVDGALRTVSGVLLILGCTDLEEGAERVVLAPGTYRLRVSMAGLDSLSADGLEGDDKYRVQIWPGPWRETVVRQMHEPGTD